VEVKKEWAQALGEEQGRNNNDLASFLRNEDSLLPFSWLRLKSGDFLGNCQGRKPTTQLNTDRSQKTSVFWLLFSKTDKYLANDKKKRVSTN
jgi:hypothetical protein